MVNILEIKDLTKIYPGGVVANYKVNFSVREGEIHALVGENGAGKTTLMKMIFGFEDVTDGKIFYKGQEVHFTSTKDAIDHGIGMVHQHFMLVPSFTVTENLTLGIEPRKACIISERKCRQDTLDIAEKYGFNIDVDKKVRDISVGMKQKLEILKVLYRGAKVIILDEPTAVLTPQETSELFEQLIRIKKMGYTIIFISHKLDEVKYLSDRLTILKQGRSMGTYDAQELTQLQISELMVGREISTERYKPEKKFGDPILEVRNINYTDRFNVKKLDNVNFMLRKGEILGIAGVEGNGQSEVISIINGGMKQDSGQILINGKDISKTTIKQRREEGISYIPEDRMVDGCATGLSVRDNIITVNINDFCKSIFINNEKADKYVDDLIKSFDVLCKNNKQSISSLSGGNIQKAIVAREFSLNAPILIINQPTRGIDIGSIEFIHRKIIEKRKDDVSILLASADLTELTALSDRIIVFCKGHVVADIDNSTKVDEAVLGLYMLGMKRDDVSVGEDK